MRPRFTILTLLGFTAYVALNVAAFAQPLSYWPYVQFGVVSTMMFAILVIACGEWSNRAVFCRGFMSAVVLFLVLSSWEPPWNDGFRHGLLLWPEWYFFEALSQSAPTRVESDEILATLRIGFILQQNVQLAFGLIGGFTAVWRYRVLKRRAKTAN